MAHFVEENQVFFVHFENYPCYCFPLFITHDDNISVIITVTNGIYGTREAKEFWGILIP